MAYTLCVRQNALEGTSMTIKLFARGLALAIFAFGFSIAAQAATDAPRTIVMTGEAEVKAQPDQAMISGGAVTQAKTASEAVAANSAIMSRVFDAIEKLGIP